ncbi:hypothetical protein ACMYR2_1169 [Nitrobacter sp. TKz-YC01]
MRLSAFNTATAALPRWTVFAPVLLSGRERLSRNPVIEFQIKPRLPE